MEIPWKLYLSCWFLGAAVQSAVFFTFNAADYFNYFFPDQYKPEVYLGVTVGVGASLGAVLTVFFQPKRSHLTVLVVTLTVSAILLVIEVVVTPLNANALSNPTRFGSVIAVVFVATVVLRLSGYLFVALVDLIILIACCLIAILRAQVNSNAYAQAGRLNTSYDNKEQQPLLRSDDYSDVSRKRVIRNNWAALATVCLTLVISNALFPGITSQFHGNYNCSSSHNITTLSSDNPTTPVSPSSASKSSDQTGWFIVILFGCYSVADAIGKNLPIFGICYNKKSILGNCLVQLVIAIPILLIYFEPCDRKLQADWVAYLTVGLLGLVNGYGLCAAMMLLAPGQVGKKQEEGLATSIGYMFLQVGILLGMGVSVFLVDYVFEITKHWKRKTEHTGNK